jgi:hypothetical protein
MKKIFNTAIYGLAASMLTVSSTLAQSAVRNNPTDQGGGQGYTELQNPLGNVRSINDFISAIIDIVLLVAYPVLVLAFIWIGFQFVMAQGKADKLTKVKTNLWYTLLGALVIIGAKAISLALNGTIQGLL